MKVIIDFQDKNHKTIAIHYIEYNTIAPPYLGILQYCERVSEYFPEVYFCYTYNIE